MELNFISRERTSPFGEGNRCTAGALGTPLLAAYLPTVKASYKLQRTSAATQSSLGPEARPDARDEEGCCCPQSYSAVPLLNI